MNLIFSGYRSMTFGLNLLPKIQFCHISSLMSKVNSISMTIVPKMTFCTVVKNRVHHVKSTLPRNLAENSQPFVQFDLLDYNSDDGLGEYIRSNFPTELETGKLNYYHYDKAVDFKHSHSRNIAFRLAQGGIICNLDADNFAGENFGNYVIELFGTKPNICLTGLNNRAGVADAMGKMCVKKQDFEKVGGFDESFKGYGYEDYDLVNRLALSGVQPYVINRPQFLQAITHSETERFINDALFIGMHSAYIKYHNTATSSILFLLKDGSYQKTTVINAFQKYDCADLAFNRPGHGDIQFESDIKDCECGTWKLFGGNYMFSSVRTSFVIPVDSSPGCQPHRIIRNDKAPRGPGIGKVDKRACGYHEVIDKTLIYNAAYFVAQIANRGRMIENLASSNVRPNPVYGMGTVVKNFDKNQVIDI